MRRCETEDCNKIVMGISGSGAPKRFCDECGKARTLKKNRQRMRLYRNNAKNVRTEDMCSAIGCYNKRGKGLRKLCDLCYTGRTNDLEFEHRVGTHDATVGAF